MLYTSLQIWKVLANMSYKSLMFPYCCAHDGSLVQRELREYQLSCHTQQKKDITRVFLQ